MTAPQRSCILNVDDYGASRDAASNLLREAGFDVIEAASGGEALRLAGSMHPQLVLLDVKLPDLSGYEVCGQLKADPETSSIPILMVSGHFDQGHDKVRGLNSGADGYLVKPVEAAELIATIRALLRMRAAEAARFESEARFRSVADNAPVMIWMAGPDKSYTFFNERWLDFTGRTLNHQLNQSWTEGIHPEDRERYRLAYDAAFEEHHEFSVEYRLRHYTSEYRWIMDKGIPRFAPDGTFIGFIGSCIDITERRETDTERAELLAREQAAREEAESYSRMLQRLQSVTDIALSHMSLDALLTEMLGRICELLETQSAAIMLADKDGKSLVVRAAVGLEREAATEVSLPFGRGIRGRIAATRKPFIVDDLSKNKIVSPLLREKYRAFIGAPLLIDDRLVGVIHAATITPRHFTADDLKLLQLVAERAALAIEQTRLYEAEQSARREAEMANRIKDEFLATVSHELRAPLTAILGWVRLLREGHLDAGDADRAMETIERSARTQNRIINDLLDVSNIITGKLRLNVRPIEPVPVIESAVEALRPAAEAKAINLEMSLDEAVGPISADSDRLQEIVWNLVSNAIRFTPKGGSVQLRLQRESSDIEIIVSDTGAGISSEFLPYVFDRFRQGDSSSTRRQGGLGLGLAIVRHLVELHGGTVRAESAGEDQGATFTVKLPLMIARDERKSPVIESDPELECPPELESLRVLVVDDDPDARALIRTMFDQCGAEVRTAASAREALEIFMREGGWQPELLVSDIEMPETDGYSLIRNVRKLEAKRGGRPVAAMALTAYGRVDDRLRALSAGFQMHMVKPVESIELLAVAASLTGRLGKKASNDKRALNSSCELRKQM